MFALYLTMEHIAGQLETSLHATYESKKEAEQIGDNLRLLYSWVKKVEVRELPEETLASDPPHKIMAPSTPRRRVRRKKSS